MKRVLGLVVVALMARTGDAFAEEARRLRSPNVMVGLNLQGLVVPLPGVQLGLQPHWRVQIDGGLLAVPMIWFSDMRGVAWNGHVALRVHLREGMWSPYAVIGIGWNSVPGDQGDDTSYEMPFLGAGIDLTTRGGFTTWLQVAPARYTRERTGHPEDSRSGYGVYITLGTGYRIRGRAR